MKYKDLFEKTCEGIDFRDDSIVFKFEKDIKFHDSPMRSMQANPSPNILEMNVSSRNNYSNLTYKTSTKTKLSNCLKQDVSRIDFLKILLQITRVLNQADNYYANKSSFIIDEEYIYVDTRNFTVSIMYFPLDTGVNIEDIYKKFILRAVSYAHQLEQKDVSELNYLFSKTSYRIEDAYKTIYFLINGKEKELEEANQSQNMKYQNNNDFSEQVIDENMNFDVSNREKNQLQENVEQEDKMQSSKVIPPSSSSRHTAIPMVKPGAKPKGKKEEKKSGIDWGNIITNFVNKKMSQKNKGNSEKKEVSHDPDSKQKSFIVTPNNAKGKLPKEEIQKPLSKPVPKVQSIETQSSSNITNDVKGQREPKVKESSKNNVNEHNQSPEQNEQKICDDNNYNDNNSNINDNKNNEIQKNTPESMRNFEDTQLLCEETQLMCEETQFLFSAWLIRKDKDEEERIEIKTQVYKIGRDSAENDLVLDDVKVSKKHAEIIEKGGTFYIIDKGSTGEGSTNGVYLNDTRIEKVNLVELKSKDEIKIAKNIFVFYTE